MGLIQCPDCGGKVSTLAAACPHCGCPNSAPPSGEPSAVPEAETWYVRAEGGDTVGPVSTEAVIVAVRGGKIPRDALVARTGASEWTPLSAVPGLAVSRRREAKPQPANSPPGSSEAPKADRGGLRASWRRWNPPGYYAVILLVATAAVVGTTLYVTRSPDAAETSSSRPANDDAPHAPPPQLPKPFAELRIGQPLDELTKHFPSVGSIDNCQLHLVGDVDLRPPIPPNLSGKGSARCADHRDIAGISQLDRETLATAAAKTSDPVATTQAMEVTIAQVRGALRANTVDEKAVWESGAGTGTPSDALLMAAATLYEGSTIFAEPRQARRPISAVIAEDCSSLDAERVRTYVLGGFSLAQLDGDAHSRVVYGKCRQPFVAHEAELKREFVRRTGAFAGIGLARASTGPAGLVPDDPASYLVYSSRSRLDAKTSKLGVILANGLTATEAYWKGAISLKANAGDDTWGDAVVWVEAGKVRRVLVNFGASQDPGVGLVSVYGAPTSTEGTRTRWDLAGGLEAVLDVGAAASLVVAEKNAKGRPPQ